LKNILLKLSHIHDDGGGISHLNLSTSNIYFNNITNEIFLGPVKFLNYEENSLWYNSPEINFNFVNNNDKGHIMTNIKNDIWSLGCILAEMFFVATPLFQSFSTREKIRKLIETLGMPKYEDVSYMQLKEYNLIADTYFNKNKQSSLKGKGKGNTPLIYEITDYKSADHFKKEVFNLLLGCLKYNPNLRPSVGEMLNRLIDLDDFNFNYAKRFERQNKAGGIGSREKNNINDLKEFAVEEDFKRINDGKKYNNEFPSLERERDREQEPNNNFKRINNNYQYSGGNNKNKIKQYDEIGIVNVNYKANNSKNIIPEKYTTSKDKKIIKLATDEENDEYKNLNSSKIILI
jgi:serine/threonine protein kinase